MPITEKQVAKLHAMLHYKGIFSNKAKLDWLYENGVNIDRVEDMHRINGVTLQLLYRKLETT